MKRLLLLFALAVVAMSCGDHCPSNEIWYTSADGNIVEPYSGEGSQDNFTVFGANIVSNKYDADKDCWVITFDGDITSIGDGAFAHCSSLTSVTIPDSVTWIFDNAFEDCCSLTSVTIPDGVMYIYEATFLGCSSLISVTIPDRVREIGERAFSGCSSLTSVYCNPTTPPAATSYMFEDNAPNLKIYVPAESVSAYKSASGWSEYKSYIVGYDL